MVFQKLRNRDSTSLATLDRDDLALNNVIAVDGGEREGQNMHVQRLGKGVYAVHPMPEDEPVQPLHETELLQRLVD